MKTFIKRFSVVLAVLACLVVLPQVVQGQTHGAEDYTYTFVDTARLHSTIGNVSNNIDMNSGTTTIFEPGYLYPNNVFTASVPLPFVVQLGRSGASMTRYNFISMNDNGIIRLQVGSSSLSPSVTNVNQGGEIRLSPFAFDTRLQANSKVHYKTVGNEFERVFVLEFRSVRLTSVANISASDITYQVRIYENTGLVEFVYGAVDFTFTASPSLNPVIGLCHNNTTSPHLTFAALNTTFTSSTRVLTSPTNTFAQVQALSSSTEGTRRAIRMQYATAVAAPSGGSATGVTKVAATLNWTDNANDESGFAVFRSQPGGTAPYDYVTIVTSNATQQTATGGARATASLTGLLPGTSYTFKVYAVRQGRFSTALDIPVTTTASATYVSNVANGNWSTAGSWLPAAVPGDGDVVTIQAGHTITVNGTNACTNLTVDGTLNFDATTNRSLTVSGDMEVNSGGLVQTPTTSSARTHTLTVQGDLNLNSGGTMNLRATSPTHNIVLNFTGNRNATFTVAAGSTLDLSGNSNGITINKTNSSGAGTGMGYETILEMVLNATPTVADAAATSATTRHITLTSGTLKISGTATWATQGPNVSGLSVPANAGLWLNNSNVTIHGGNYSISYDGYMRFSAGNYNVGTSSGNALTIQNSSGANLPQFIIDGGTVDIAGRFEWNQTGPICLFAMSSGTLNVATIGSASSNPTMRLNNGNDANRLELTGGQINIVRQTTGVSWACDYDLRGAGTIVQFGSSASPSAQAFTMAAAATTPGNFNNIPNLRLHDGFAHTLTLSGTVKLTGTEAILGNGTTFAIANNVVRYDNGLTLTLNGGTLTRGTGTLSPLVDAPTDKININYGTFPAGTKNTGDELPAAAGNIQDITIAGAATDRIWSLQASPTISGNVTLTGGTLAAGANTITLPSSGNVNVADAVVTSSGTGAFTTSTGTYNVNYNSIAGSSRNTGAELNSDLSKVGTVTVNISAGKTLNLNNADRGAANLTLTSGEFALGANDFTMADGGNVTVTAGTATTSGGTMTTVAGAYNISYLTTASTYTTGAELSNVVGKVGNITVNPSLGSNTLSIGSAGRVANVFTITKGLITGGNNLTFGNQSSLVINSASSTWSGTPTWAGTVGLTYNFNGNYTVGDEFPAEAANALRNLTVGVGPGNVLSWPTAKGNSFKNQGACTFTLTSGTVDLNTPGTAYSMTGGNSLNIGYLGGQYINGNGSWTGNVSAAYLLQVQADVNNLPAHPASVTKVVVAAGIGNTITLNRTAPYSLTIEDTLYIQSGTFDIGTGNSLTMGTGSAISRAGTDAILANAAGGTLSIPNSINLIYTDATAALTKEVPPSNTVASIRANGNDAADIITLDNGNTPVTVTGNIYLTSGVLTIPTGDQLTANSSVNVIREANGSMDASAGTFSTDNTLIVTYQGDAMTATDELAPTVASIEVNMNSGQAVTINKTFATTGNLNANTGDLTFGSAANATIGGAFNMASVGTTTLGGVVTVNGLTNLAAGTTRFPTSGSTSLVSNGAVTVASGATFTGQNAPSLVGHNWTIVGDMTNDGLVNLNGFTNNYITATFARTASGNQTITNNGGSIFRVSSGGVHRSTKTDKVLFNIPNHYGVDLVTAASPAVVTINNTDNLVATNWRFMVWGVQGTSPGMTAINNALPTSSTRSGSSITMTGLTTSGSYTSGAEDFAWPVPFDANTTVSITGGITSANPAVVTVASTATFSVGSVVFIRSTSSSQVNERHYRITALTPTTITLDADFTTFGSITGGNIGYTEIGATKGTLSMNAGFVPLPRRQINTSNFIIHQDMGVEYTGFAGSVYPFATNNQLEVLNGDLIINTCPACTVQVGVATSGGTQTFMSTAVAANFTLTSGVYNTTNMLRSNGTSGCNITINGPNAQYITRYRATGGGVPSLDWGGNTNVTWTDGSIYLTGRENAHANNVGDIRFNTTGTVTVAPPATLYITGTTANTDATAKWRLQLDNNGVLPNVVINPTSGADNVLLTGTVPNFLIKGYLNLDNGVVNATSSTVTIGENNTGGTIQNNGGTMTVNTSAPFASMHFNGAGSFTMPAGITNLQNFTVNQSTGSNVTLGANLAIGAGGAVVVGNSGLLDGGFSVSYGANGSLTYSANNATAITAGPEWVSSGPTRANTVTLDMSAPGATLTFSGSKAIASTFERKQGALSTGTLTYDANANLKYSGSSSFTAGAIEWPSTSAPTNVLLEGATVTLPGSFNRTVTGNLTLESGSLALVDNTVTIEGNIISTTATPTATVTTTSGKLLVANGASAHLIAPVTYGNLELDDADGFLVTNSNGSTAGTAVVSGTLTLTNGVVNTADDDFLEVHNSIAGPGGEVVLGARIGANTNLVVGGTGAAITLPTIQDLRSLRSSRPGIPDPNLSVVATIGSVTNPAILALLNYVDPLGYTKDPGAGVIDLPGGAILGNVTYAGASSLPLSTPTTGTVACSPNIMVNNMTVDLTGGNTVNLDCNLTVRGKLTLINGGINPGSFAVAYQANGSLEYQTSPAGIGAEWPATSGPRNVTIEAGSLVIDANRTLGGNLLVKGSGITFSSGVTLTVNGDITSTGVAALGTDGEGTVVLTGGTVAQNMSLAGAVSSTVELNNSNGFNLLGNATFSTLSGLRLVAGSLNLGDADTLTYRGSNINNGCGGCAGNIVGYQSGVGQPYTSAIIFGGTGNLTIPSINGLQLLSSERAGDVTLGYALPCTTVAVSAGKIVGTGSITYLGTSNLVYLGAATEPGIVWPATSAGAPANIGVFAVGAPITLTLDGSKTIGAGTVLGVTQVGAFPATLVVGSGNTLQFTRTDGLTLTGGTYSFPSAPPATACTLDVRGGTFIYTARQNAGIGSNFFDNANPGAVLVDENSTLSFSGAGDMYFPYLNTPSAPSGEVHIGTVIVNRSNLGGDAVDFNNPSRHPSYSLHVHDLLNHLGGGAATGSFAAADITPVTGMEYRFNTSGNTAFAGSFAGTNSYDLNYTGTGNRTVGGEYSSSRLRKLKVNTTGTVTFGSALTVADSLLQNSGTLAVGANAITVSGNASLSGTGLTSTNNTTNAFAIAGNLTVNAGYTLTMAGGGHIRFNSSGVTPQLFNGTHAGVTNINITVDQGSAAGVTCSIPWTLTGSRTMNLINGNFSMGNTLTCAGIVYITRTTGTMDFAGGTGSLVRTGSMMDMLTFPDGVFSTNPVVVNNLSLNNSGAVSGITLGNQGMTVNGALTLTDGDLVVGASTLNINGTITRSSANINTDNTSTLGLGGTVAYTIPNGTFTDTPTPLAALNISNTAGVTWNNQNIETGGVVTFQSGAGTLTMPVGTKLDLLDAGSLSGETNGRYVIGRVERTATAMGTGGSTFGNIGYRIYSGGGDMGDVTVLRTSGAAGISAGYSGNTGIARTYEVTVGAQPVGNRTVDLRWVAAEDNGRDATKINLYRSTDAGVSWTSLTGGFVDATAGQPAGERQVSGNTAHFSLYTATDIDNPLPVTFMTVTAARRGADALVSWTTATEQNTARFEVQRSLDGTTFETISQVEAAGNSSTIRRYQQLDMNVTQLGTSKVYYRIKSVDLDGSTGLSPVTMLNLNHEGGVVVSAVPNPFSRNLNLHISTATKGDAVVTITDVAGRTLHTMELELAAGATSVPMASYFEGLSAGIYHISISTTESTQRVKVVKQ